MFYSRLKKFIKRARNNQMESLEMFLGSQAKFKEPLSEAAVDNFDSWKNLFILYSHSENHIKWARNILLCHVSKENQEPWNCRLGDNKSSTYCHASILI